MSNYKPIPDPKLNQIGFYADKPISDEHLAELDQRRAYWNKYAYESEGHEIVHPMEYDALRERLRLAESKFGASKLKLKVLEDALKWYANLRLEVIVDHNAGMSSVPHRLELGEYARAVLNEPQT